MENQDWMNPGKKPMAMLQEDSVIDLHDTPHIEHLDAAQPDLFATSGVQHYRFTQTRKMDFLG